MVGRKRQRSTKKKAEETRQTATKNAVKLEAPRKKRGRPSKKTSPPEEPKPTATSSFASKFSNASVYDFSDDNASDCVNYSEKYKPLPRYAEHFFEYVEGIAPLRQSSLYSFPGKTNPEESKGCCEYSYPHMRNFNTKGLLYRPQM